MKRQLADFTLYRLRYILGYSLLGLIYIGAVIIASIYTPGGLTQTEIDNLSLTDEVAGGYFAIPNVTFHMLQSLSLSLFGVSILSIKLPAIVLSVVAAVSIFFLLRRWFKPNIAVLSMLIMTTTGQIIYVGQNATSHILYVTFTALILLFASLILQKTKHQLIWKLGLAVSAGLSWYTPYFIYVTLGLLLVALIHPHTRHHLFKKIERPNWFIAFSVFVATIAPLAYLCTINQSLILDLIGYGRIINIDIVANLQTLFTMFFWTRPISIGGQIAPIMDFSSLIMIIFGVLVMFRQSYTSRSYMIVAWLILTLPIIIIHPTLVSIITIPLFILLAVGVESLLSEWYKLFPKNPYARGAGLVLLTGLIGIMTLSGIDRFAHGYRYMPEVANIFSSDIRLVKNELNKRPARAMLVVGKEELPIYKALEKYDSFNISVTLDPTDSEIGNAVVTKQALSKVPNKKWELQRIVTNGRVNDADRLYIYNTVQNQ